VRDELADHPFRQLEKLTLRVVATSDPGLIRHDHDAVLQGLCRPAQLENRGLEVKALPTVHVAVLAIDDAVAVEKESPATSVVCHVPIP
jgi:hypothetical protein